MDQHGQMDMYPRKFRSDSELPLAESMDFHGFSWIFMDASVLDGS